ncbi:MAG: TIR domain-containing protein [Methyloprofundus sp.]|nr:TIR domain-containing protein [Methyloprofundus sp.]
MSEIAGFKYDIFISYCHDDNYPTMSDKGWVDQFHDRLENWLKRQRRFKQLTIWRDLELNGNTLFEKTIEDTINSSALFFVLHSKNYEYSDYCKKELEWFVQHNAQGTAAGEHSRIFHLLLNNFPYDSWSKQLAGTSGFVMHDAQDPASLGEFTEPNQSLFTEQLRKIVDATDSTLSHLIKNATPADLPTPASDKRIKIFLADTADNQATFRKRIIADLKQQGVEVIANSPPPYEYTEHKQYIQQLLQDTQLSIHLLGEYSGREIQGGDDTSSYPCEQVKLGFAGKAKQIIWIPKELDIQAIEDPDYQQWINQLENGERDNHDYEFIRSSQSALSELILQEIEQLNTAKTGEIINESFLIDTHQLDQQYAFQLAGIMAQKGIDVEFNKESKDPIESLNIFEQSIQQVPNLIIIFGQVSPQWLKERIKRAFKIIAAQFAQDSPLQLGKIWIFLTPDSAGLETLPKLPKIIEVEVLDNSAVTGIDPTIIQDLFAGEQV